MRGWIVRLLVVEALVARIPEVVMIVASAMVEVPLIAEADRRADDRHHMAIPMSFTARRKERLAVVRRAEAHSVAAVDQAHVHAIVGAIEHPHGTEIHVADLELAGPVMGLVDIVDVVVRCRMTTRSAQLRKSVLTVR